MNYFPNNDEEISLIRFLAKYQYLSIGDSKYFFSSKRYYRDRIRNLITKRFIKKVKLYLVLDELGVEYAKLFNFEYNKRNRNRKYIERLKYLSHIAALYNNCKTINFTPSFSIKDKEMYTITSRRFIGILEINKIDYLTYHISDKHDVKYVGSVLYDIQKERKYKNIIILINDINRINIDEFAFGMNKVLILEDSERNLELIKYMNNINIMEMLKNEYKNKTFISEFNFCDYIDKYNNYISISILLILKR